MPLILSPDQEMLPARNLIDAHAQVSVAYDGLLLLTPNELIHFTRHYTLLEILDVFSLCVVAEMSFATNGSLVVLCTATDSPPRVRILLWSVVCNVSHTKRTSYR